MESKNLQLLEENSQILKVVFEPSRVLDRTRELIYNLTNYEKINQLLNNILKIDKEQKVLLDSERKLFNRIREIFKFEERLFKIKEKFFEDLFKLSFIALKDRNILVEKELIKNPEIREDSINKLIFVIENNLKILNCLEKKEVKESELRETIKEFCDVIRNISDIYIALQTKDKSLLEQIYIDVLKTWNKEYKNICKLDINPIGEGFYV